MYWKIEVVMIPVSDIDRSKEFYGEKVGFPMDFDHQLSETSRLIQFTPEGSGCSIQIGTGISKLEPGTMNGLIVVVPDVAAARQELLDRGVEATPVRHFENGEWADGPGERWNSFVFFNDPDGNEWILQEQG